MAYRPLPPQETLLNLLEYDPNTGALRWRPRKPEQFGGGNTGSEANCKGWNKKYAGEIAGMTSPRGHVSVHVGSGKVYKAHRIIWKMVTGQEPDTIDHINGEPSDNRWSNLRSVAEAVNHQNMARRTDNSTGVAGVFHCPHLIHRPWRVRVTVDKKNRNLGYFATFEDAVKARNEAKRDLGFTERHGVA